MSEVVRVHIGIMGAALIATLTGCYQSHEVADGGSDAVIADASAWCEPGATLRFEDCPAPPAMPINTYYIPWNVERHVDDDGDEVEACQCMRSCNTAGDLAPCDNYPGTDRRMTCARRPLPLAMEYCYLPCAADADCPARSTCVAIDTPSVPAPEGVAKACLFSRGLE